MKSNRFLYLGMGASLLLHLAVSYPLITKNWARDTQSRYPVKTLVSVHIAPKPPIEKVIKKPEPLKVPLPVEPLKKKQQIKPKPKHKRPKIVKPPRPVQPEKPKKKPTSTLPASNKKTDQGSTKKDEIKPVFGMARESFRDDGNANLSVRVGNTLMKSQEEEFTPAEEVKDYYAVPPFELSRVPFYKVKVVPEYPESLKEAELEGEVLLAVTIDEQGKVVALKVKRSNNELFSEAAKAALKKCEFTPGMQNGVPVTTIIDIPIKFVLDE